MLSCHMKPVVAPLTGSVDRNEALGDDWAAAQWVAPLTGSVDRNDVGSLTTALSGRSLPSRGAWIEMFMLLA